MDSHTRVPTSNLDLKGIHFDTSTDKIHRKFIFAICNKKQRKSPTAYLNPCGQ